MKIFVTYVTANLSRAAILETFGSWKGEGYYAQITPEKGSDGVDSDIYYLGPFVSAELADQAAKATTPIKNSP